MVHQALVNRYESQILQLKEDHEDQILHQNLKQTKIISEQETLNNNLDIRSTLLKSIGLQS